MTTATILAWVGAALMVGLSGLASSIGTSIAGMAAVGAMKKNKGAFGNYLVLAALPGSQGLYGFVGFMMLQDFLNVQVTPELTLVQGAAIFAAGLILGLVSVVSSYMQAKVCANGITAIGNGHNVLGNTLIMAAYPELYAILAVAIVYIIGGLI